MQSLFVTLVVLYLRNSDVSVETQSTEYEFVDSMQLTNFSGYLFILCRMQTWLSCQAPMCGKNLPSTDVRFALCGESQTVSVSVANAVFFP